MKKALLLFSVLFCCTFCFSQSIFLSAGPTVPTDAPQGQPVLSYSFGAANEMTVTLVTGIMSPELMLAVATGTGFSKMDIKVYDNQNKVSYKITLHDVLVTSIQIDNNSTEQVTLSFKKKKIKDSDN